MSAPKIKPRSGVIDVTPIYTEVCVSCHRLKAISKTCLCSRARQSAFQLWLQEVREQE